MRDATQFNWGPGIFLITYQVLFLLAFPFYLYYYPIHLSTLIVSIVLLYATGLSITGGYHRYFSHRTYKTHPIIESILLFFGAMAVQGSALRWSFDHRQHHAFVDTDKDPYSIKKGFWYAHFLWILEKPRTIDPKTVPDLINNPRVMFQNRYSALLMLLSNVIIFFVVGWSLNDYMGAFFLACWARLIALHHFTWFINSLAHTWGDKPFSQEQTAVDNYFISFLTFGEGYHNYHHTFANDYRNGVRWYHFDPTKWLIWTLSKLGLAKNLKRMDPLTIKKRLVVEHKNLLIDHLSKLWSDKKSDLEKQVQDISDKLLDQLNTFQKLTESYRHAKIEASAISLISDMNKQMKEVKRNLKREWKNWKALSNQILSDQLA